MRVVVAGYVAGFPVAGLFWHAVAYARGFADAGHDVWFLDDSGDQPWSWDLAAGIEDPTFAAGLRFVASEMDALGLGDRWFFRHQPRDLWFGPAAPLAEEVLATADVLVNVSMAVPMRARYRQIPVRLGIDTDPVFTQIRMRTGHRRHPRIVRDHTHLFTFGRLPLPAAEHHWLPTRQPVAVDHWPVAPMPPPGAAVSTVASWKAYRPVTWEGVRYGVKDSQIELLADLPGRIDVPCRIALAGGAGGPAQRLTEAGWDVLDPADHTADTAGYRALMVDSVAEIGIAKHGYVISDSGWFSERSCLYLATGRPVLHQRTGWQDWLPDGEGLLGWSTPEEAARAVATVLADPEKHSVAARRLVEEHFDAATVCNDLLEQAL